MTPWLAPVVSLVLVLLLTPVMMRIAHSRGWVAHPTEDRWHDRPTALMGGVAIFAAVCAGWGVLSPEGSLLWIWVGGAGVFALGFLDDRIGVPPWGKLAVQLLGAALLLWAGLQLTPAWPLWIAVPLTVLWVVGITNAVNLLDNMDGLAAGVSAIGAATIAVLAWQNGQRELVLAALVLAAAAGGFLAYNFHPARTFMGDCGSLFLGFSLAGLALTIPSMGTGRGVGALVLVPAAVMAVPILDTTLVSVKRLLVGRSPAKGGRDHTSHRLVALGLSDRAAVLTLYALAAGFGAVAVVISLLEVAFAVSLAIYAGLGLALFGAFLSAVRVYDLRTEEEGRIRGQGKGLEGGPILKFLLRYRRTLVGSGVDVLIVLAGLIAAFHLRYDGRLPEAANDAMLAALPITVLVKLAVFHGSGLYRALWWHAGSPEIARTLVGAVAGSAAVIAAFVLLLPHTVFPRSVLILDWILTSIGLVGVRFGFRGVRGVFQAAVPPKNAGARALVYGAGPRGVMAVRELRENGTDFLPVAFLDDDPEKIGRWLLGLPVAGSGADAAVVAREFQAHDIIIAFPAQGGGRKEGSTAIENDGTLRLHEMGVVFRSVREHPNHD